MAASISTQARGKVAAAMAVVIADNVPPFNGSEVVEDDKLDQALGQDRARIATYPLREEQDQRNALITRAHVMLQCFLRFDPQINENQKINPGIIEMVAEEFKEEIRSQGKGQVDDPECWYLQVVQIEYPDDPTGNKTRFTAEIVAYGQNTNLLTP